MLLLRTLKCASYKYVSIHGHLAWSRYLLGMLWYIVHTYMYKRLWESFSSACIVLVESELMIS